MHKVIVFNYDGSGREVIISRHRKYRHAYDSYAAWRLKFRELGVDTAIVRIVEPVKKG